MKYALTMQGPDKHDSSGAESWRALRIMSEFVDATDALARPEVREQLRSQGLTPVLMKPVEFAAHIKAETATWAGIIKARSIVAE
jgi:hypothetical protein